MNSRYYLTLKSTFLSEKPKKLDKTSFNDKILKWDKLHLTAQTKETYFSYCSVLNSDGYDVWASGRKQKLKLSKLFSCHDDMYEKCRLVLNQGRL